MYENQTVEAIKARILTSIDESQGLSSMAGGFADGVAGPVSEELSRVYQALNAVPSMLFVEHDARFCDTVATRRIRIERA